MSDFLTSVTSVYKIAFAVLFAIVISVLTLLAAPFYRTGNLFHYLAKIHARATLAVCGVKVRVEGLDQVDFKRTYVYVANHASQFDIPSVIAGIPDQIRLVFKKELARIPIFGWALKYGRTYICIDRGKGQEAIRSLDEAARKIHEGASVLLFAEGTRTPDGRIREFRRGAFSLAVRAGVPVVPLTINGSYSVLRRGSFHIRPGIITLVLGRPVVPSAQNGRDAELDLRDRVGEAIQQNYREQ
jgi:1-acyl-sn-glycerol-3-phosphate acyltransferase